MVEKLLRKDGQKEEKNYLSLTKKDLNRSVSHTLGKTERLKSKKQIASLFDTGSFFVATHLKVVYQITSLSAATPVQVAFSVSKSKYKRAVDRNLLKRRMREAYRQNKHVLCDVLSSQNQQMALMFIYRANAIQPYGKIEKEVVFLLEKISRIVLD